MRYRIAALGLALALAGCSLDLSDDPHRFDEQRFDRAREAASRAAVAEDLVTPGLEIETGAISMDEPCAAVEVRLASGRSAPFLVVVEADGDGLDDRWHFVTSSTDLDAVVDSSRPRCGF